MKKVLIITYYWPPSGGSGVQRWVKFAKYLPSCGWQPIIYTPLNPELTAIDETLASEIPQQAEIIRTKIFEPYSAYRKLFGKGSSTDIKQVVTPISGGKKSWKQKLSLWVRANLFVPDPRVGWVRPSVRFIEEYLKENPVDAMVTTGPPHSLHLIGLKVHKDTGLPWVPDFRDPWSRMYYLKHLPYTRLAWNKLLRQEKAVLDGCTKVLAVTPQVREDFLKMTGTPVAMITNGYDEEDFTGPLPEPDGHFNITHTGLFASDGNPKALWTVLGEMAAKDPEFRTALKLRLAGKNDREVLEDICKAGLEANLILPGYLDHPGAVLEQRAATILILPLRNDPQYKPILPGKLFEYLGSRRPILGIGQEDGAMAEVINECSAGTVCDWSNKEGIMAFISGAWTEWKASGTVAPTSGPIDKYTRSALTRELSALLDEVAGK